MAAGRELRLHCAFCILHCKQQSAFPPHHCEYERGDDETDREPDPQPCDTPSESKAKHIADGQPEKPEADDVDDHRHARVAEPAQQADRDDLEAVEYLEQAGERQQQTASASTAARACKARQRRRRERTRARGQHETGADRARPSSAAALGVAAPTACPTMTAAADDTPSGTMNASDARFSAIWCAPDDTGSRRPASAVATAKTPTSSATCDAAGKPSAMSRLMRAGSIARST